MSIAAVRADATTGVEERLEHVPTSRGQLYTWAARPPQARSCVLVCSSVFGDFSANYYRERLLGRALVSQGIGVIRFHYAGEGNSQGERRVMTFSSLCDDAAAVLDHAVSLGFTEFALLGTRMGALVAAATVASMPAAPLALWEPVVQPLRFIADADRARRISQLAQGGGGPKTDWRQELERNGVLDLVGYEVYPPLIDSLEDVDLVSALGSLPRRVFIVRFRGKAGAADPLADALVERGFSVQTGILDLSEAWWFHTELVPETGDLITATTAWLTSVLSEAA
jgi:pimeloyl-ACP methyl ester carboxylesterase